MPERNRVAPTIIVIFGAGGDLTHRKLVPALFNLGLEGSLPDRFALIGVDRLDFSDDKLRTHLREGLDEFSRRGKPTSAQWDPFGARITYLKGDFNETATYASLNERLSAQEQQWGSKATKIFYLAVPPFLIETIVGHLGNAKLNRDRENARVVVEKPIGHDSASALELNRILTEDFEEHQIFRIDHYLGKETVQNILAFRFANSMFEPIWNRRYVDHVTITVAEEVGVEHRGGYYDHAGALRDMVQNHLLQLLCLVAMEPPLSFLGEEIRNKKADVLQAIRPIAHHDVHALAARGQYGPGWMRGEPVVGYREEEGVAPDSATETYAALKLFVDNWRWQDVPFYLRTGKRLPRQVSEVSVRFRNVPHQAFPPDCSLDWEPARLVICIQPDEGIILKFLAKQPGQLMRLRPVDMRFSYQQAFQAPSPDAYETLLWDIMVDDTALFMRQDQVEAAWSLLMPILDVWGATSPADFPNYPSGTWGPQSAEVLIAQDGRTWNVPTMLMDEPGAASPGAAAKRGKK